MLRYRKNLAIIAAISLALNLQGVGAVADEAVALELLVMVNLP